jgi:COP9 signalosome complex subunit 1
MLIPHLSHHLSNLTASIRRRALIQYFQPFESVKLSRMAAAFGLSEEVVLQEIIELVGSGEIDGRIDLPNKVRLFLVRA